MHARDTFEALSLEGISVRLLASNGALVDRGEQCGIKVARALRNWKPIEESGRHASSDRPKRFILVRECIYLAPILCDGGGLHVIRQFGLEIDCGCIGECFRARLWWRRGSDGLGLDGNGRLKL